MASDKIQFERAQTRWQVLANDQAYSVPRDIGNTAIIVSFYEGFSADIPTELKEFADEAKVLATEVQLGGGKAEVVTDATGHDITRILRDPDITDIITIGHGALSYLYVENGLRYNELNNRYDWRDVSHNADHLKTGRFIQRHCGNASRRLSVPLGSFAMQAQNWVIAATNKSFNPTSVYDPGLNWVPTSASPTYKEIKTTYSYDSFLEDWAEDCPPAAE